ncbi:TOMM precursor leader peptide-binding protein [Streptomyces sp. NPDC101227]|uniref:TOMM precursor leader peptide-binding protein n=1 Tax=Streptomyces sp. NPDC101227 TaxID=3366136 RepID=UPI003825CA1B
MHVVTLPTETAPAAAQEALAQALRPLLAASPAPGAPDATVEIGTLGLLPAHRPADAAPRVGRPAGDGAPVLPVRLHRDTALVGPLHSDADTPGPCALCLERRWIRLRPLKERAALETGTGQYIAGPGHTGPYEWGAPAVAAALHALTRSAPDARAGESTAPATVLEVNLVDGLVTEHQLLADPQCPRCGGARPDAPPALYGFPASRPRLPGGGARLRSWRSYGIPKNALINPVCGALGFTLFHDMASPVTESVGGTLRLGGARTGGSGLYETTWAGHTDTYDQSEMVALFEGLERYAGQRPWGGGPALRMALDELSELSLPALDPRGGLLYDDDFYARHRETFRPFRPDERVDWVWGHSLVRDAPVLVPQQLVYYGPRRRGASLLSSNSNGCATGSCLEEAALFGLLELIERDAFLLAWYGAEPLPEIGLDSATGSPALAAMRDKIEGLGYTIRLFDMRIDLPVPAVLCLATLKEPGLGNISLSAGAALSAEDAVASALREVAAQLHRQRTTVRERHDEARAMAADYRLVRELEDHELLYGLPEMAAQVPFAGAPGAPAAPLTEAFADWEARGPRPADLLDDLRECVRLVGAVSEDVIVVDQTCPEQRACGLHTAAVVAPGLLPIDFGWEQQRALHHPRLRTASWRAGRRAAPLADADVHRHPHPFP